MKIRPKLNQWKLVYKLYNEYQDRDIIIISAFSGDKQIIEDKFQQKFEYKPRIEHYIDGGLWGSLRGRNVKVIIIFNEHKISKGGLSIIDSIISYMDKPKIVKLYENKLRYHSL